jgi:hypothetical protein
MENEKEKFLRKWIYRNLVNCTPEQIRKIKKKFAHKEYETPLEEVVNGVDSYDLELLVKELGNMTTKKERVQHD